MLGYKEVGEILSLIDASSCSEVVLELEGVKLVVRRGNADAPQAARPTSGTAPAAPPDAGLPPAEPGASPMAPAKGGAAPSEADGDGLVRAPMLGTFYRAPKPDEPPFVEIGSEVKEGDALCMIEVMKLFTTIHAERAGIVRDIPAENGQLVEFGQVLFEIGGA